MTKNIYNKGGRPPKEIKRNKLLGVKCSATEQIEIKKKAEQYNISISEFLRDLGLKNKVSLKTLPQEVIVFQTKINNISANINQIARKRNMNEQLNAIERAELKVLSEELHSMVNEIRQYIKNDFKG